MPPKRGARRQGADDANGNNGGNSNNNNNGNSFSPLERRVANESLLATDNEREATSASLYSDHKARISANLSTVRDRARNAAFSCAFNNSFPGKTVLYIGCGIGIQCMMAARAGAKFVVGIDTSSIVHTATELAKQNNLNNVVFVQGRFTQDDSKKPLGEPVDAAEKAKQVAEQQKAKAEHQPAKLPMDKFDVIFCEWMGTWITNDELFAELEYAVAHHLAPGGIVCPNRAQLHVVGLSDFSYRADMLDYWDNVYGFTMAPMKPLVMHEATTGHIPKECIATKPAPVHQVDLATALVTSTSGSSESAPPVKLDVSKFKRYSSDFKIVTEKKCTLHFLTFYLSASFTDKQQPRGNFILPFGLGERNSFTEVSLTLPTPIPVFAGDEITGRLTVNPVKHQHTELTLSLKCRNAALPNGFEMEERYLFQY